MECNYSKKYKCQHAKGVANLWTYPYIQLLVTVNYVTDLDQLFHFWMGYVSKASICRIMSHMLPVISTSCYSYVFPIIATR